MLSEILPDTVRQLRRGATDLQKRKSGNSGFLTATGNPDFLFLFVFLPQIFSQEYINLLLSMYFFVLGILALSHTIRSEGSFFRSQYRVLDESMTFGVIQSQV